MPLGKAPLPIQFSGGVELRQDPKQVPVTKLIDLQNCVFTRQTTLSKRNGYRALSRQIQDSGSVVANARGLAERDGELLVFTDRRCLSYRPSADRWVDAGEVAATTATTLPIARTGTAQTQPDAAELAGVRVVAWEDSRGGVWCSVLEASTGRILLSQTQLDSAALALNPRCLAVEGVLHVLWTRSDLAQIKLAVINPASPTVAPVVAILTADLDPAQPFYDAEPVRKADDVLFRPGLIAWATPGGFRVGYITGAGALGSPAGEFSSVATHAVTIGGPIGVAYDPSFGVVAVMTTTGAALAVRFLDGAVLSTITRAVSPIGGSIGGYTRLTCAFGDAALAVNSKPILWWAAEVTSTRTDLCRVESGAVERDTAVLDTTSTVLRGHNLVSRAWFDGTPLAPTVTSGVTDVDGDVYVMVAHTARFYPYVAAIRISARTSGQKPSVIVSRLMPGESTGSLMRSTGSGTRAWTQHLPSALALDLADADVYSRKHAVCLPYRIQLSSQNGDQFSEQGLKFAEVDFEAAYQTAQLGRGLYLASSAPMHYDGEAWREADFHCAPDFGFNATGVPVEMSTQVTTTAGGSVENGTYLYAYWYEAVDAQGELHRGPVSTKLLVTMTGGPKSFVHQIPTCRLTRFSNVRICVARSEAGATGTDLTIPLFKVTDNDVTIKTGSNRYVDSDPNVDTVAFTDGLSDTELKKREPLYTNGGILSNDPSPWGGGVIAASKSRLYWTDSTDPHLVRYSQTIEDDTAIEAPIALSLRVDPFGGGITAIGALDDTVIPFTETATYVFGGPGPLRDPSVGPEVNAFTPVELVTSDVGCVSPASIGQTPLGITFQSRKGIKLLSRQRQMVDIGKPVDPLNTQRYTRTTLLPDRQSIIYLTDTEDGFSLLWDYEHDQWAKFSNHLGIDAVVLDGVYHYLRKDSRVFVETPGVYLDDNLRIPMLIETAWIHFHAYLQGWQKILYAYFLGQFISDHELSVRYRIDYNEGYSPAILSNVNANWSPSLYGAGAYGAGVYGGPGLGGSRYQRRIHLNRRCQAISFRIEDVEAPGDFGASFELSEMLLIGGGLGFDFKVGAERSA